MFYRRFVVALVALFSLIPIAIAAEKIDVVVKPDYSTGLAGQLSDSLYRLIDQDSRFSLVPRSSGFHLEFEVNDVVLLASHRPQLVALSMSSTLYKKKYHGVDNQSLLIDRGKAMCDRQLFKVCELGIKARLDYALDVALQNMHR